jgi:rhodanese-related sulfurtransferase
LDPTWGEFLDTSGVRVVSGSAETLTYYAPQLLTDCVLVDLRAPEDYAAGHLAGAVNLAANDVVAYIAELKRETPIIVYSSDGATSDRVAYELWTQGRRATSLLGGLAEWTAQRGYDFIVVSAR